MESRFQILFVCTGNTCRSPMAEGIFRKETEGRHAFAAISAGVAAYPGQLVSRETLRILERLGIDFSGKKSQLVTDELVKSATHIFTMTRAHREILEEMFPLASQKTLPVLEFLDWEGRGFSQDVPDPIGLGMAAYEKVAEALKLAIPLILNNIKEKNGGIFS